MLSMKSHQGPTKVSERRIRKVLGEEVCNIQMRPKEVHTQLAVTDVVTNTKVAGL